MYVHTAHTRRHAHAHTCMQKETTTTHKHLAAKSFDIIRILLNYGANPNIVDNVSVT